MQNLGGQIRCIMANVEVAFARDELCLQTRIGGEIFSSKGPGLDWGIWEIFARGIRNPESWALESGVQLKEKNPAKELNVDASSTDKEFGIQNPQREIQKPRLSRIP